MVLYVWTIQQRSASPEKWQKHFDAASKCQGQITVSAQQASLAQRYGVVLEELRLEALRQTRGASQEEEIGSTWRANEGPVDSSGAPQQHIGQDMVGGGGLGYGVFDQQQQGDVLDAQMQGSTPTSLLADLTSWGEFDSLVCPCPLDLGVLVVLIIAHRSRPVMQGWRLCLWTVEC